MSTMKRDDRPRWRRRTYAHVVGGVALAILSVLAMAGMSPVQSPRLLQQVVNAVREHALEPATDEALFELAARGLVAKLGDPYSELYSPEEARQFYRQSIGDEYAGLGVEVAADPRGALVTTVFDASPAQAAGMRPGDRIISADGVALAGMPLDSVIARLLGPPGSWIHVAVNRGRAEQALQLRIQRAAVHRPAVPFSTMIDDRTGYIPLGSFSGSASHEVGSAIADLRAAGAEQWILDLRGNGGGRLQQAIAVASHFLPPGTPVLRVRSRDEHDQLVQSSRSGAHVADPLVVLIDESSASASEIVAGALQDADRAFVVGTRSFGKGLVQDLIPLDGGWTLKLTTARWYTPSGRSIHRSRANGESTDSILPSFFRTAGGRVLVGGGGITPDSIVPPDTLNVAERELAQFVQPHIDRFHAVVLDHAVGMMNEGLQPDFRIEPESLERLRTALSAAGIAVPLDVWNGGLPLIRRVVERRTAGIAFGEAVAFRRMHRSDDALTAAMDLVGASPLSRR